MSPLTNPGRSIGIFLVITALWCQHDTAVWGTSMSFRS